MQHHHQDWKVVVFKKSTPHKEQSKSKEASDARRIAQANQTMSSTANRPAWKIEQMALEGERLPRVSKDDAQKITALRVKHKLTRAQLAQRVNMKENYISDIETCKAVENKQHIAKILSALERLDKS